jgi:hypothetical protein
MPRNGGKKMRMSRFNRLQPALVPLGNSGVTPAGQGLSAVNIDAEIQFYGKHMCHSKILGNYMESLNVN